MQLLKCNAKQNALSFCAHSCVTFFSSEYFLLNDTANILCILNIACERTTTSGTSLHVLHSTVMEPANKLLAQHPELEVVNCESVSIKLPSKKGKCDREITSYVVEGKTPTHFLRILRYYRKIASHHCFQCKLGY